MTEPLTTTESTAFSARADVLAALNRAASNASAASSSGVKFHKLDATENRVRVAQDPRDYDNPWVIPVRQHKGLDENGKFKTVLDLAWLNEHGRRYPGLDEKLTTEDREAIAQFGDPAAFLAAAIRAKCPKLDELPEHLSNAKNKPFSEFKAVITAIKDGTPGLLEVNQKSYDTLMVIKGSSPQALTVDFGYDLNFTTNGKSGMAKRYNPPIIMLDSQGAIEYAGQFPKSVQVLQSRVLGYRAKREFVLRNYGPFIEFAGLTADDFRI